MRRYGCGHVFPYLGIKKEIFKKQKRQKTWQLVNEITQKNRRKNHNIPKILTDGNKKVKNPQDIAKLLNTHFGSISEKWLLSLLIQLLKNLSAGKDLNMIRIISTKTKKLKLFSRRKRFLLPPALYPLLHAQKCNIHLLSSSLLLLCSSFYWFPYCFWH